MFHMKEKSAERYAAVATFYFDPSSETYNNFRTSMAKAGYSTSYIKKNGAIIRNSPKFASIKSKVAGTLQHKTALSIEHIQNEHQRLQSIAETKGDLATATRNLEDLGKTIAAYEDKVQTVQGLSLNFNSEKEEKKDETDPKVVKIA